jgi:hypothetical protein
MKNRLLPFIIPVFFGLFSCGNLFAQKYPVGITNFNVTPSVFLSDYTTPGSGNIKATLKFTDYNEASVNVYLKLTIESANAKLETSPSFRPVEPLTLVPGEPLTIQDVDFIPYFLFQNLQCQGITQADLQRTDQLPEGWYTFSIQVIELTSGKALSQSTSMRVNFALIDPPILTTPERGKFIKTSLPQINFQWQHSHAALSKPNVEYYLRLYEIPDGEDPLTAMQNKRAREVALTDAIHGKTYLYGPTDFPLTPGKRYAYTITAQDVEGRKWFKNNGVSEVGWFYYGYPIGGNIALIYPKNEEALNRNMLQRLEWAANDNLVDGNQPVVYYVKVVEALMNEDPALAIYRVAKQEKTTGVILNKSGYHIPLTGVESEKRYAWQVIAYTENIEVGKSTVQTFYAPPVIDQFVVGFGHIIEVSVITNPDLNDFSGKGKVKISTSGEKIEVHFEHIQIKNIDGLMMLTAGEIKCSVSAQMNPIPLIPSTGINDKAICYPDSIRIDSDRGMYIQGRVEWDYPFGTLSKEKSKVKFQPTWFDYNDDYRLRGTPIVIPEQSYELLEPSKFHIKLNSNSFAYVLKNQWEMVFSGQIFVHENIKGTQREAYSIDFTNWRELHYNVINDYSNENEVRLIANTQLNLVPRKVVVDLSEERSPLKFAGSPDWKGIYFENFDVRFIPEVDDRGQIKLTEEVFNNYTLTATDTCRSWIIGDGLHFRYATQIAEEGVVLFNTFPSKIDWLNLDIQKSTVMKALLKGSIRVPVISQIDRYAYSVPITNSGFQTGYLDKSLDGLEFVFNTASQDQQLQARIKRAIFAGQNRLDMDLEMKWEKIGVTFSDLQQFCAWGDYQIGFITPKGVANLTYQTQGIVEGSKINVEQFGCGRMCNQYAFAVSASVVIEEDIAGAKGAPKLNFYSIADNILLTGDCDLEQQNIPTEQLVANEGFSEMTDEGVGEPEDENTLKEIEELNKKMAEQLKALNNANEQLYQVIEAIHYDTIPAGSPYVDLNQYRNSIAATTTMDSTTELSIKEVIALLELSKIFLDNDIHPKINKWIDALNKFDSGAEEFNDFIQSVKNGSLFEQIVDIAMDQFLPMLFQPITETKDKLKDDITKFVDKYKDQSLDYLDNLLVTTANSIKTTAKQGASMVEDQAEAEAEINKIIDKAVARLQSEIRSAVDKSIKENFTGYFTNFLDTLVDVRLVGFVDNLIRLSLKKAITGQAKEITLNGLKDDCKNNLNAISDDFKNLIKPENLLGMLQNTGTGIINNFHWQDLLIDIGANMIGPQLEQYVNQHLPGGVQAILGSGTAKDVLNTIKANVDIDFNALKNGNIKDAIKFDPTAIKIESSVASGSGYAQKIKDDPVYGDVFKAGINVTIKVPKPFNAFASFVSGKQKEQNFDYWFVEFGARKLGLSMTPIPLVFDGGSGRVFKKMSRPSPQSEYVPDINNRFGAGVAAYFYDQSGGGIAIFDVDFELKIMENGFDMVMSGNALLGNNINLFDDKKDDGIAQTAPASTSSTSTSTSTVGGGKPQVPVSKSIAIGHAEVGYSNITDIFYANANVTLGMSPIICGSGEFNALITPDEWALSVGTRENPLSVKLLCLDNISLSSWFAINKHMLDVGLKLNIDISLKTPWINCGVLKARAYTDILFRFGGEAVVYWKPLRVRDASVYVDLRLALGVEYETWFNSGSIDLLAIGFGGNLTYLSRTREDLIAEQGTEKQITDYMGTSYSMLYGRLYGYVTIIGFKLGVDIEAKKEWKK